jgi:hypothetical protein
VKEKLDLPEFDIPELNDKQLTPAAIQLWIVRNYRRLCENGVVQPILDDPLRCPVDARFVL